MSGSGARGIMIDTMNTLGADSFAGRLACCFQGSCDTTFYILAVYFGSVSISKTRHAVVCGLLADLASIVAAIVVAYILGYFTIVALLRNFGTFGTIFVLRRKPKSQYNPSYRAPLGYTMPIIAMFMTFTLIVSTFSWAPLAGVIASVVTVGTGLPAFFF